MGIGFAIPVNMAKDIYKQIIETGSVTRGYLGVIIRDLTPEMAESFGVKGQKGVLVDDVTEDGPAEKTGIEHGDIIIEVNGKAIGSVKQLLQDIAKIAPGSEVKVTVLRDTKKKDFEVILDLRPSDLGTVRSNESPVSEELGITVHNTTDELAERFGYAKDSGVIIVEINRHSPLAQAGIKTGALIREVNGENIKNVKQFLAAIKKSEGAVLFYIQQGDYSRYVRIKLN